MTVFVRTTFWLLCKKTKAKKKLFYNFKSFKCIQKFFSFNFKNVMLKTRLLIASPFTIHQNPPVSKYETLKTKRAKLHTKAEASCDTHYRDFTAVGEGR